MLKADGPAARFRAVGGLNVPVSASPGGLRRLSAPWPFGELALFDDHLEIRSRLGGVTVALALDDRTTAAALPRAPFFSGVYFRREDAAYAFSAGRRNRELVRALQAAGVRFTARPSVTELGRTIGANAGARERTPRRRALSWALRAVFLLAVTAVLLSDWYL